MGGSSGLILLLPQGVTTFIVFLQGGLKQLRMRHRSGGASDSGAFSGGAFDLQEATPPPPSAGATSSGAPVQTTPMLSHFPLFSPLAGSFGRGGGFISATSRIPTTCAGNSAAVASTQQGAAARRKASSDATKFPRVRCNFANLLIVSFFNR